MIHHFDWALLVLTLIICAAGLVVLYSAVATEDTIGVPPIFYKQMAWHGLGLALMVFMFCFSYKQLEKWGPAVYIFCLALLGLVLVVGVNAGGSTRWLGAGPFMIQPSEPVKIAVIIILARYFAKRLQPDGLRFHALLIPIALTAAPFLLVLDQPDLGTAGAIALMAASMTLFAKINRFTLICCAIIAVIAVPAGWQMLHPYQKDRVMTLLSPDKDPLGAGYHIRQSKIAVGSGLVMGKGYLQGTQKKLAFLPEQHTDFIFSVLAEEWGFTGSMSIMFLFLLLMAFGLNIAHGCREPFGVFLSVGVVSLIFWQTFINMGMVIGIMPVVGMPLPLISYGGSAVVTLLMGIGILMNVSMRRFLN